jgi:hypothetical protein
MGKGVARGLGPRAIDVSSSLTPDHIRPPFVVPPRVAIGARSCRPRASAARWWRCRGPVMPAQVPAIFGQGAPGAGAGAAAGQGRGPCQSPPAFQFRPTLRVFRYGHFRQAKGEKKVNHQVRPEHLKVRLDLCVRFGESGCDIRHGDPMVLKDEDPAPRSPGRNLTMQGLRAATPGHWCSGAFAGPRCADWRRMIPGPRISTVQRVRLQAKPKHGLRRRLRFRRWTRRARLVAFP